MMNAVTGRTTHVCINGLNGRDIGIETGDGNHHMDIDGVVVLTVTTVTVNNDVMLDIDITLQSGWTINVFSKHVHIDHNGVVYVDDDERLDTLVINDVTSVYVYELGVH